MSEVERKIYACNLYNLARFKGNWNLLENISIQYDYRVKKL